MTSARQGFPRSLAVCSLLLLAALLATSCATILRQSVDPDDVNSNTSVVFGKAEFVFNGLLIDYRGQSISHCLSTYTSDETVRANAHSLWEYVFSAKGDDGGYFAAALPPGKYYFVHFMYAGVIPGFPGTGGIRTYTGLGHTRVRNPYIITFDVPPNKAVYIGTIRHDFGTPEEDPASSWLNYLIATYDDFDRASKWFLKSREKLAGSVIDKTAVSTPFNPTK